MTNLEIATMTFGEEGVYPRRRLQTSQKTLDTPAKAVPAAKIRQMESLSQDSRKAAELYTQVDSGLLKEARHDPDESVFERLGADKVEDGEVSFAFTSYQDAHTISEVEARQLTDATAAAGDFVTVPLQPKLSRNVDPANGLRDSAYQSLRAGTENALQAAREEHPNTPIFGVLPMLGQAYIKDLLDLYVEYDVRAFCLNFDRKKITASRQVSLLQPLARYLTDRGIEEEVLIYAINMNPRDREIVAGVYPAANFAAVGLGVDVVGENHVPPRLPPEVFEEIESGKEEDAPEFRFFDKEELTFREILVENLPENWPDDSALDVDRVMERSRAGAQARSRMESLFTAEQLSLALQEFQESLEQGTESEHLGVKDGITDSVTDAFEAVRESFDDGRDQSGLSNFR